MTARRRKQKQTLAIRKMRNEYLRFVRTGQYSKAVYARKWIVAHLALQKDVANG